MNYKYPIHIDFRFDLTINLVIFYIFWTREKENNHLLCHNKYYVPRQEMAPDLNNQPREKDKQRSRQNQMPTTVLPYPAVLCRAALHAILTRKT